MKMPRFLRLSNMKIPRLKLLVKHSRRCFCPLSGVLPMFIAATFADSMGARRTDLPTVTTLLEQFPYSDIFVLSGYLRTEIFLNIYQKATIQRILQVYRAILEPYNSYGSGRCLFRPKRVIQNIGLLEELLNVFQAPEVYCITPSPYIETLLDEGSNQYEYVTALFNNEQFLENYRIKGISHISNPYLFLQYQLMARKFRGLNPRMLFHGTQIQNLNNIFANNFDWRRVKRRLHGMGVYFANNPWLSSVYSLNERANDNYLVMIVVSVLIGQTCPGNRFTRVPIDGDTVTDPDGEILVKFDDACFYPEFGVYFEKRSMALVSS